MNSIIFILISLLNYTNTDTLIVKDSISYNRNYFKHWIDEDNDCQDTRTEVLIKNNLDHFAISNQTAYGCEIKEGIWYDIYSDAIIKNTAILDIDHVVPLKNAWLSGAWKWTEKERGKYANYIDDDWHLIPVFYKQNRNKGYKSPDEWMPENKQFHVTYCIIWTKIKVKWKLTMTEKEINFIKEILKDKKDIIYPEIRK